MYLSLQKENGRIQEMVLSKEKAKGTRQFGHPSWLRIYALKFEPDAYLERVRRFFLEAGAVDIEGFKDLNS